MKRLVMSILLVCSIIGLQAQNFNQEGLASYYADNLAGSYTAYGEAYNPDLKTAAHPTLPVNTLVKVTNLTNGKSVMVKINDKLVETSKKSIMLSKSAAADIGLIVSGCAKVKIEQIDPSATEAVSETVKSAPVNSVLATEVVKSVALNSPTAKPIVEEKFGTVGTYDCEGVAQLVKGYGVQVAALTSMKAFKNLCNELSNKEIGVPIYVQVIETVEKTKLYRVMLGNFDTYNAAREKLTAIATLGYKAVVRTHATAPVSAGWVTTK